VQKGGHPVRVSQPTLIILAAFVWYSGGIALIFKGSALIKSAHLMDPQSMWAYASGLAGILAGLIKGKFLFSKACSKNVKRIRALEDPHIWHCFRPGMLLFLAIIIPTGAWMSKASAGNYTLLCLVGALDLSISFALLSSSIVFWELKAFFAPENSS
jgi:hypothetical protein